jgi:hypothetical protein
MKATGLGALIGAAATGLLGLNSHIPGSPGSLSLTGEILTSAIPGLIVGAIVGFIVHLVRR